MGFEKITEKDSLYNNLHKMSTEEIINNIHKEDQKAVKSIHKVLPKISILIDSVLRHISLPFHWLYRDSSFLFATLAAHFFNF